METKQTVTGRFAPSPSGRMHLGNLMCSLVAWLSARSAGGRMVLRIEDLDPERCPRHYADQLEEDLHWLGLDWDEGGSAGGEEYYQSNRTAIYQQAFDKLDAMGLVYPCFCSRAQVHAASAPHRSDGQAIYPGTCRHLTEEERAAKRLVRSPAARLMVPDEVQGFTDGHMGYYEENLFRDCGDFILRRSDGVFAYQLAVVVDDAAMGVTQVVRGSDLLTSSVRQGYLYRLLGLPVPEFCHVPLLLGSDGHRLAKRSGDIGLEELQSRYTPEEVIGRLAYLVGQQPDPSPCTAKSLIERFDWNRVPTEDICLPDGLF